LQKNSFTTPQSVVYFSNTPRLVQACKNVFSCGTYLVAVRKTQLEFEAVDGAQTASLVYMYEDKKPKEVGNRAGVVSEKLAPHWYNAFSKT
jgi:cyclic lactone autoinducer peptide